MLMIYESTITITCEIEVENWHNAMDETLDLVDKIELLMEVPPFVNNIIITDIK
jgi:hypothetical protein